MSKKLSYVIISIALVICMSLSVAASSLSDTLPNSYQSGWSYSPLSGHMGTKYSTYRFEFAADQNEYGVYFSSGIALWGSNVSMICVSPTSSSVGKISVSYGYTIGEIASTDSVLVGSNGHRTSYTITIYATSFDEMEPEEKALVIAHEIGHAYGLGHVTQSTNLMHDGYVSTISVTSQDIWGMKVVTHVHNHSSSTTGKYIPMALDDLKHQVICGSCKGIYFQDHTFNSYNICTKCGYEGYSINSLSSKREQADRSACSLFCV